MSPQCESVDPQSDVTNLGSLGHASISERHPGDSLNTPLLGLPVMRTARKRHPAQVGVENARQCFVISPSWPATVCVNLQKGLCRLELS